MVTNNQNSHFSKENGVSKWNIDDNLTFTYYDNVEEHIFGSLYNITIGASTISGKDEKLQLTINIYEVLEEKIDSDFMKDSVSVTFSKETKNGQILKMHTLTLEPSLFRTIATVCSTDNIYKQNIIYKRTSVNGYLTIISSFVEEIEEIRANEEMQKATIIIEPYLKESLKSTLFAKKSKKKVKSK